MADDEKDAELVITKGVEIKICRAIETFAKSSVVARILGNAVISIQRLRTCVNDAIVSRLSANEFEGVLLKSVGKKSKSNMEKFLIGLGFAFNKDEQRCSTNSEFWFLSDVEKSRIWKIQTPPMLSTAYLDSDEAQSILGYTETDEQEPNDKQEIVTCSGFYNAGDSMLCGGIIGNYIYFKNTSMTLEMNDKHVGDLKLKINPDTDQITFRPWAIYSYDCNGNVDANTGTKHRFFSHLKFCSSCTDLNKKIQKTHIRDNKSRTQPVASLCSLIEEDDSILDDESKHGGITFHQVISALYIKATSIVAIKEMRPVAYCGSVVCGFKPIQQNLEGLGYSNLSAGIMQLVDAVKYQLVQKLMQVKVLNRAVYIVVYSYIATCIAICCSYTV